MLLFDAWTHVYDFLPWDDGFALRVCSRELLSAWDALPKERTADVTPRRSFICMRECMACDRDGDDMVTITVPWAIMPPKGVAVCCNHLSCKYQVLRSFQNQEPTIPFAHVLRDVLPSDVTIVRSSGKKQEAHCTGRFVCKPEGTDEWHVLVWWFEENMTYTKYVPYSSVQSQASGPLVLAKHM